MPALSMPAAASGATLSRLLLISAVAAVALTLLAAPAHANPPVDAVQDGACLELKVDGQTRRGNNDLRLVDDGAGEVVFVTGYDEPRSDAKADAKTNSRPGAKGGEKFVVAFTTAQTPELENAYGYALRVSNVTLMTVGEEDRQKHHAATGLCFMVKPNPVRAGATAVRQDIVVMCSATLTDATARVRRLDWKFVY